MTPWLHDPDVRLYHGDCLEVLRELPPRSVQMCATSPPFYGLRSYLADGHDDKHIEIGLEETPDQWVERLVRVFREVRRVLRDDGTLWVEIGDSYGGGASGGSVFDSGRTDGRTSYETDKPAGRISSRPVSGQKPKDLLGQPWLLAFALRADGWYLRSEIIWARPNPMPESVTDRPTKSHSTVFLLSKQPRYYWDAEAIREPLADVTLTDSRFGKPTERDYEKANEKLPGYRKAAGSYFSANSSGANARSVWQIPTQPTPFAHFATWPEALVRRMILAGTSERGCCPECGAPWVRDVERVATTSGVTGGATPYDSHRPDGMTLRAGGFGNGSATTLGWSPSCECDKSNPFETPPVPCTVLDPFAGSATTCLVARNHGRHSIGIELNEHYLRIAGRRLQQLSLLTEGAL